MDPGMESADVAMMTTANAAGKSPPADSKPTRKMVKGTLNGQHSHTTESGRRIQIWLRDGKFLARGRWNGQQIGVTLGVDERTANYQLQRLLIELEDGTFVPGQQVKQRQITRRPIPKLDLRGLTGDFLAMQRQHRGSNTTNDYKIRLMHVLDFAELPASQKRWRLACDINREFGLALRAYLYDRDITPNGRYGAQLRKMSPKMVRLCLEALRCVLNWAARADVRKLPVDFANPITHELLGPKPVKDPLRECPITLQHRVKMVDVMDEWQFLHLAPFLLLPTRLEDLAGALVSDFDLEQATWRLGARCGGNDFNKSRVEVQMPLPAVLVALLRRTIGGKTDGPMFCARRFWRTNRVPEHSFSTRGEFESLCDHYFRKAKKSEIGTEQDRKKLVRRLIRDCGGVATDAIGCELKKLMAAVGIDRKVPPYQIRAAVTTELHRAGVPQLELRYLTMHSPNDILNEYTTLDPRGEMEKYFRTVDPLLKVLGQRAAALGFKIDR